MTTNPVTVTTFEKMIGKTFNHIEGCQIGSEDMRFVIAGGETHVFYYQHDCCASCNIVDVIGDVADLVGSPIVLAEEVSTEGTAPPENADSYTWTFYRFGTAKGTVTVRWLGESNGYYSESVTYAPPGEEVRP